MPERIKRIRRRRRISAFPAVESIRIFRRGISPERLAIFFAAIALAIVLGIMVFSYGSKIYSGWRERRLLQHANTLLQKQDYTEARTAAEKVLQIHPDSLPAYKILADATEKQNLIDTVAWRAQIARLRPRDLDSQLNLVSAALRFGGLDTARKAMEQIEPAARGAGGQHVGAGGRAR